MDSSESAHQTIEEAHCGPCVDVPFADKSLIDGRSARIQNAAPLARLHLDTFAHLGQMYFRQAHQNKAPIAYQFPDTSLSAHLISSVVLVI